MVLELGHMLMCLRRTSNPINRGEGGQLLPSDPTSIGNEN